MAKMIMNSNNNTESNIMTAKGTGSEILIKRGVKQGCSLSPILFNLHIDSLLMRLNNFKENRGNTFGQYMKEEQKTIQAYADGILLFY
jgi:hypothetical protein